MSPLIFDRVRAILVRRDKRVMRAWGRGFRLPFGLKILSTTNCEDGLVLISRHPKWSITWTFALWWWRPWTFRWKTQRPRRRSQKPRESKQ